MAKLYHPSNYLLRRLATGRGNASNRRYSPFVLERLLELMDGHDDCNRDWATFFVARSEEDTGKVRQMLLYNATDQHQDVSAEAILGLARRRDSNAIRFVKKALERKSIGLLDIKAAGYVADRTLLSRLYRIQKWLDTDIEYLNHAIEACKNNGRDDYNFD